MNTRPLRTRPIGPQNHGIEAVVGSAAILDEPTEDVWHVQVAAGDVRVVSLEKLDDLYRYDVIDEKVFVWQKGMDGWIQLATLLAIETPEPEEPFHVLVSPGNVKQLSLEQLDDFYRIDVIDEGTLVWQTGMTDWLPLGKIAGIEAEPPTELPTRPLHAAAPIRAAAPLPAAAPEPWAQLKAQAQPQPQLRTQPLVSLPASAPPVAFSIAPPLTPSGGSSGRWLVRLSVAAGVLLSLFRNDLAFSAVHGTALGSRYAEVEGSLFGGPIFGTSRSVEKLVAECGGHLDPVRLPIEVTQFADQQQRSSTRASGAAEASTHQPSNERESTLPKAPPKNAESAQPIAKAATPLSQNVAAALGGLPTKPAAAPAKAVTASTRPAAKKRSSNSKSSLHSNGNYFDPLNPTL